jgi:hypothetical protein
MKLFSNPRARWYLLAVFWATVITLGIGGFVQQAHDAGVKHVSIANTLYNTMSLATLNYYGSDGPLNWRVQLARFVVPLMAASTVLQTASLVFVDEFTRWRTGRAKGHTIVCGLGDTGSRLAKAFADAGERVVALDTDAALVQASRQAKDGVAALTGDATDLEVLKSVRVDRAKRLVVTAGADARNVAIASNAASLTAGRGAGEKALRCSVQLRDAELTKLLRAADLDAAGGLRLSYFSLHERAARALLSEHPPFDAESPRPLVIGLGQFGRSLVVALAQQWAHGHPGERLKITMIDEYASGRWAELVQRHPALDDVCLPELIDLNLNSPSADGVDAMVELLKVDRPTWIAVVLESEALALANAVFAHQQLPRGEVPIVVRMRSAAGLGTLLDPLSGSEQAFPGVEVFPFLDRTCTTETVDGGVREELARAFHEDYLAHIPAGSAPSDQAKPWDELDDDDRDLSRRRVDGIIGDLASIGCQLEPLRRWGAPMLELTADEEDALASREHMRWYDDRTAAGWTYGPERDNAAKKNPLLRQWDELPPEAQASNVEQIRDLQPMLLRAGFEVTRLP